MRRNREIFASDEGRQKLRSRRRAGAWHLQRFPGTHRERLIARRPGAKLESQICVPHRSLEVGSTNSPFTHKAMPGQMLNLPVAHGEGCYVADESTWIELEAEDRVVLRYLDNPNGSMRNIAGIVNTERNVMGMMPHPERASDRACRRYRRDRHLRLNACSARGKAPALALSR